MTSALRSYEYWLTVYRRVWRGTVMTSVLNPVLYLAAMGIGLGTIVRKQQLGLPYLDFVAPGLLAAVAMQVASVESSFPVRGAIRWNRQYFAMLATPLRVRDLVTGHLLYGRRASPSPCRSILRRSPRSARCTRGGRY
jgi:lipooligosaccharide transport system permease protein